MSTPNFKTKLFFWLILGCLSTFFAEVISGSFFFPFTRPTGIILIIPLYTLHLLALAYIVYNYGKAKFYTLFIAGTIFGMYEAYATGVLWVGWGNGLPNITLFGLGVIESLILVLFWHPLMAFVLPIIIGETILTKSSESLYDLKKYSKLKYLIFFAILFGFIQSFNTLQLSTPIIAETLNISILAGLIYLWRKKVGSKYVMRDLLPNRKEFKIILFLLILMYVICIVLFNHENIPDIDDQAFVWIIYIILFFLLYKGLQKSLSSKIEESNIKFSWKIFLLLATILIISATIFSIIVQYRREYFWLILISIYIITGSVLFITSIKKIFAK